MSGASVSEADMGDAADTAGEFLVTFRTEPGILPDPICMLRIQAGDGETMERIESLLANRESPSVSIDCQRLPGASCFRIRGSLAAIRGLLELDGESSGAGKSAGVPVDGPLRAAARRSMDSVRRRQFVLELPRRRQWEIGPGPAILGVLNVTPDSFSDGNRYFETSRAVERGAEMIEEGADAIDVGGESTRPGSRPVPLEEEVRRVAPVVAGLRKITDHPISVDTSKREVARVALEEGADIVNDVTALEGDPGMVSLLRDRPVPVVLMHKKGEPLTMQDDPRYDDATAEILMYLARRLLDVEAAGIARERTLVDPGIGFGKRSRDNLALLRNANEFCSLGRPLLVGLSRKSFLGRVLGKSVGDREAGTLVANTLAVLHGASVIRTHNIPNARELKRLLAAVREYRD